MERALHTNAAIENILKKYADTVYRIAFVRVKNKDDAVDIPKEVFVRFIKRDPVFETEEHEKAMAKREKTLRKIVGGCCNLPCYNSGLRGNICKNTRYPRKLR